jgi:hypothetical protein
MRLDMIVGVNIKPALEQPGCPICFIRNTSEARYLANLLHEYVNDYETRIHIIASLGYCEKHAWQMGLMETEMYGDAVGNAIIYEGLVQTVIQPLARYKWEIENRKQQNRIFIRFAAWLKAMLNRPAASDPDPFSSLIRSTCRVCQTGESAQMNYLEYLLKGLSDPEPELRESYLKSGGLCFQHFRKVLSMQTTTVETGVNFLINHMLERLPKLRKDLRQYTDKHAWDRRLEPMFPDERSAWIQALRFFAGNEGNVLLDDLKEPLIDDRVNSFMRAKYD